jgi:hypothetical protein
MTRLETTTKKTILLQRRDKYPYGAVYVFLEKVRGAVKKFAIFYQSRSFITVFTTALLKSIILSTRLKPHTFLFSRLLLVVPSLQVLLLKSELVCVLHMP